MTLRFLVPLMAVAIAAPAAAQQSQSYKFLDAVRKGDNNTVIAMVDAPGATIINAKDVTNGEGALHIVVKRGDTTYLRYLLSKGADPNIRDGNGDTPMLLAVQYNQPQMIEILAGAHANPNLANGSGETPLIRAVQRRDLTLVRALLTAKADPDQTDNVAGLSARDYAAKDTRSTAIAKTLADTPKQAKRAVAGPRLR